MNKSNDLQTHSVSFLNEYLFTFIYNIVIYTFRFINILFKVLIVSLLLIIFISNHPPTSKWILRNSQPLIYPFMRHLRLFTLPLIKTLPYLTNYHEQNCFIPSPFYYASSLGELN